MKDSLHSYNLQQLQELMQNLGEPKFRAKQLFEHLHNYKTFEEMSNLPKGLIDKLKENYSEQSVEILKVLKSKDKTEKYLFKLLDGNIVEGVLMNYKYGNTICISTQVGCRMGCLFCASTKAGLIRNLSCGEMLCFVLCINRYLGGTAKDRKITNIVLMGSGEPLDNYDNTVAFLRNVSAEGGINISQRNISLSTCGLCEKIDKLANENLQITLTISLHASCNEKRKETMPIANKYSIEDIMKSVHNYFDKTRRRIVFEYTLIEGNNNTDEDVNRLEKLFKNLSCHLNLIELNEIKEGKLKRANKEVAYKFLEKLQKRNISATLRRTMGQDIDGACGMLRANYLNNQ